MDYVTHTTHDTLEAMGIRPGSMQLVERQKFEEILKNAPEVKIFPGGSGANTMRALAMMLGTEMDRLGHPAFSGGIGNDDSGIRFGKILNDLGIATDLAEKPVPTGVSAIAVTEDHERTMFTFLGACRTFNHKDVNYDILKRARYFYSTGYMWDTDDQKKALFKAVDTANAEKIPVCFDLADSFVVDRYYRDLKKWIQGRVEVLFANREELSRLTECSGSSEEIMEEAAGFAPVIAMKVGKKGCVVQARGRLHRIPAEDVRVVDTTGAGDSFAAGFIYGMLKKKDWDACGELGNLVASRIVQVEGCRYDLLDRSEILSKVTIH